MTEWISVFDRLPDDDEDVLVFNPRDGIGIGEYDPEKEEWTCYYDWAPMWMTTHWMHLPESPRE